MTTFALLQPEASSGGAASGGGGGAAGPAGCVGGTSQLGFIAIMFAVMYFLLIRPQQKRAREHETMLKALSKGSIVRTTGGIRGEIIELDETEITLKIADKTKINVLRSHVAGPVVATDSGDGEKS